MIAKERLYLTADKSAVVAQGDERAAFLYCSPGDEIPDSAVKLFGLVDGGLKPATEPEPSKPKKEKPAPENKEQKPAENKGA